MITELIRARMESALNESSPSGALHTLAKAFKAEGMSQADMYSLFSEYRARHMDDADDTLHDAITDTMEAIDGQGCHPNCWIFESRM